MSEIVLEAKVSTSDLTHRLFRKYDTSDDAISNKYIVATQVRTNGSYTDRTADAVIVGNWPSSGNQIEGFEIKISRSDWLNELKDPSKHVPLKKFCHRFWLLIASESMVKEGELPDDWGLMVAHGSGIRIVKKAPELTPVPPSVEFVTGLMRANKRDHIPEDLHKQYLNDAKLDIERTLKSEYSELKKYVKMIDEAFGIQLEREKSYDYRTGKNKYNWNARVRGDYRHYSPDELKTLIESVLSGDMKKAQQELASAMKDVEKVSEILSKYKVYSRW